MWKFSLIVFLAALFCHGAEGRRSAQLDPVIGHGNRKFWGTSVRLPSDEAPEQLVQIPTDRLVGGVEVTIKDHPYQVSIRHRQGGPNSPFSHLCGGSIYNASIIITAAHCVNKLNTNDFMIVAGTTHSKGSDGVITRINRLIQHEDFTGNSNLNNDIAIVVLSSELPIDNVTIAAIPLAEVEPRENEEATVTGWGSTGNDDLSDALNRVEVPIVSREQCEQRFGAGLITAGMICAGSHAGGRNDVCKGDSGGPMVVDFKLAGIISWGSGCDDPNSTGVYTNVAYFLDWIRDALSGKLKPVERFDFL